MFVCRKLEILQTIEKLGGSASYCKNPKAFEHIISELISSPVATFLQQRINIQVLDPYDARYTFYFVHIRLHRRLISVF